ncbi:hypothetical protein ABEB36_012845 [Hypothenemus hampei]|uniref:Uncharacterized protein n=1 Tax=Hypothenemus hampei TaxID=57062 RepID=A0ABD1E5Z2_HYPHA
MYKLNRFRLTSPITSYKVIEGLRDTLPQNPNQLWEKIEEIWEELLEEFVNNLTRSMPNRINMVLNAHGSSVNY